MLVSESNRADLGKYFSDSFVIIPQISPGLLYVRSADPDGLRVTDMSDKSHGIIAYDDNFELVNPLFCEKGWFNVPHPENGKLRSYYMERVPARMWCKGISQKNTNFSHHPEYKFDPFDDIHDITFGLRIMGWINRTQHYPKTLSKGMAGRALDEQWYVSKLGYLYLHHTPVGKVSFARPKGFLLDTFMSTPRPPALQSIMFEPLSLSKESSDE